jgi:hypothetical protein
MEENNNLEIFKNLSQNEYEIIPFIVENNDTYKCILEKSCDIIDILAVLLDIDTNISGKIKNFPNMEISLNNDYQNYIVDIDLNRYYTKYIDKNKVGIVFNSFFEGLGKILLLSPSKEYNYITIKKNEYIKSAYLYVKKIFVGSQVRRILATSNFLNIEIDKNLIQMHRQDNNIKKILFHIDKYLLLGNENIAYIVNSSPINFLLKYENYYNITIKEKEIINMDKYEDNNQIYFVTELKENILADEIIMEFDKETNFDIYDVYDIDLINISNLNFKISLTKFFAIKEKHNNIIILSPLRFTPETYCRLYGCEFNYAKKLSINLNSNNIKNISVKTYFLKENISIPNLNLFYVSEVNSSYNTKLKKEDSSQNIYYVELIDNDRDNAYNIIKIKCDTNNIKKIQIDYFDISVDILNLFGMIKNNTISICTSFLKYDFMNLIRFYKPKINIIYGDSYEPSLDVNICLFGFSQK